MCISAAMMMAISTGMQVVSAIQQGNQQGAMNDYQARQGQADAQAEHEAGEVRADKVRKAGKAQQSEARASLAASGVEVGAGTAVKIVQDIGRNAEEDAQQQLLQGLRTAARLDSEAQASTIAGSNARTSGYMRAGGALFEGAIKSGWPSVRQPSVQPPAPIEDRSFN